MTPGRRVSAGLPCYRLVPIDHAYSLPPKLHVRPRPSPFSLSLPQGAYFEWQHWPQAKQPFSSDLLSAIASIDIDSDAEVLRQIGLDEGSIETMRVATSWLQIGAAQGLTLAQLAAFAAAPHPEERSLLEEVLAQIAPLASDELAHGRLLTELLREAATLIASSN